ncbi:helix-turn-helix transcriptional regulator [Dactylosporangium sp. CA-139066]|uniref:helix-turn-helix transcriptional regulator n=1 Tax=Dactylosporangium sp. CA-139066 TaxID=3239930 RepID=UPI003D8F2574
MQNTVAACIGALSAPARRLLQVASAIGPRFDVLELARLMRCGTAQLLPALEEALASSLLVTDDERLSFSHDLVHAAVAATVCPPAAAALRAELSAMRAAAPGPRSMPTRPARTRTHSVATIEPAPGPAGPPGWESLTEQELHIARLVGRALTNQQIATRIGRSRHTVNYHLRRIFHKLGITSRVELASLARAPR